MQDIVVRKDDTCHLVISMALVNKTKIKIPVFFIKYGGKFHIEEENTYNQANMEQLLTIKYHKYTL